MLTIGLIIGLFVAFLVYLDDLEQPPAAAVDSGGGDQATANARDVTGDGSGKKSDSDRPRFEFYSILPELEVVVPDAPKDKHKPGASGSAGPAESPDNAGAAAKGEGPYYLQAGSFQEAAQADRLKARIALLGLDVGIQPVKINGAQWHRVRVGPYDDVDALRSAQKRLRDNDIDYLVLRAKSGH